MSAVASATAAAPVRWQGRLRIAILPLGEIRVTLHWAEAGVQHAVQMQFRQEKCLSLLLLLAAFSHERGGLVSAAQLAAISGGGSTSRSLQSRLSELRQSFDAALPGLGDLVLTRQRRLGPLSNPPRRRHGYGFSSSLTVETPLVQGAAPFTLPAFSWLRTVRKYLPSGFADRVEQLYGIDTGQPRSSPS